MAEKCKRVLADSYKAAWKAEIVKKHDADIDSKLGTYFLVNPQLKDPNSFFNIRTFELDRILLTRFRTGSHNLQIETGRHCYPRIARESRLCLCKDNIQTISHVLLHCRLLHHLRNEEFTTVEEYFKWEGIYSFLLNASKILRIEC